MTVDAVSSATRTLEAQRQHKELGTVWAVSLFVLDVGAFIVAAMLAAALIRHDIDTAHLLRFFLESSSVFVVCWVALFYAFGLYRHSFALSIRDEFYYSVAAIAVGIVPQLVIFSVVPQLNSSRAVLVLSALFAVGLIGTSRAAVHATRRFAASRRQQRIAIVGDVDDSSLLMSRLGLGKNARVFRIESRGLFDKGPASIDRILIALRRARSLECDTVLLPQIPPVGIWPELLAYAADSRLRVAFALPELQFSSCALHLRRNGDQILIEPVRLRAWTPRGQLVKRLFDLTLALPILIVGLPFMTGAVIAIWLDDGGPILYRQERVGRNGKVFSIYKFRTMRVAQTTNHWAVQNDSRVTRVGAILRRTSIDEIPQLFNVLRGEMSIVGPRPEMVSWAEKFNREIPRYNERHLVCPGITGWSQIYMKRVLEPSDAQDVLHHDLFYIQHWGLLMDLTIVCKTAVEFLFHRSA